MMLRDAALAGLQALQALQRPCPSHALAAAAAVRIAAAETLCAEAGELGRAGLAALPQPEYDDMRARLLRLCRALASSLQRVSSGGAAAGRQRWAAAPTNLRTPTQPPHGPHATADGL